MGSTVTSEPALLGLSGPPAPFRTCRHRTEVGTAWLLSQAGTPRGMKPPRDARQPREGVRRPREGEAAPPRPARGPLVAAAAGPGAPPAGGRRERAGWGARSAPCPARPPPPALGAPQAAAARRRQRWLARLRPSIPARLSPCLPLPPGPGPAPARGPSATGAPPSPARSFPSFPPVTRPVRAAGSPRREAWAPPSHRCCSPWGSGSSPTAPRGAKPPRCEYPRGRAGGPGGRGHPTPHLSRAGSRGSLRWRAARKVVGAAGLGRLPCRRGSCRPPPTSPGAGGGRRRWRRGPGLTPLSRPAAACGAPPMSAPGGCPTSARSCGSSSTWWWTRPLKRTWSGPAPWKTSPARPWGSPPSRSASSASPATTATSPGPPATNVSPRHGRARGVCQDRGERAQPETGRGMGIRGAERFSAETNLAPWKEALSLSATNSMPVLP